MPVMIKKLLVCIIFFGCFFSKSLAQKPGKADLYFLFKPDSSSYIFKTHIKENAVIRKGKRGSPSQDYDIYHYGYTIPDKKQRIKLMLFATVDRNNFTVKDSTFFLIHRLREYKHLENIEGLISDDWNPLKIPFNKVYVVEKIGENQFKLIQVTMYYAFNSNGVRIEQMK